MHSTEVYALYLVPNIAMVHMYLALALGRSRLLNQRLHSIFCVVFALDLMAAVIYKPASVIHEVLD